MWGSYEQVTKTVDNHTKWVIIYLQWVQGGSKLLLVGHGR